MLINTNAIALSNARRRPKVKDKFRNQLFFSRQLKRKLGLRIFRHFKRLQPKKAKYFLLNEFFKLYFMRLDLILVRAGFFKSIFAARQAILHKKIYLNGKIVTFSNYLLKKGDVVCMKERHPIIYLEDCPKILNYSATFFEVNYTLMALVILKSSLTQSDLILNLRHFDWTSLRNRKFFF